MRLSIRVVLLGCLVVILPAVASAQTGAAMHRPRALGPWADWRRSSGWFLSRALPASKLPVAKNGKVQTSFDCRKAEE